MSGFLPAKSFHCFRKGKALTGNKLALYFDFQFLFDFHYEQYKTENHVLLAIETELKQAKYYCFSVAMDSMAKSKQACGKSRETSKF